MNKFHKMFLAVLALSFILLCGCAKSNTDAEPESSTSPKSEPTIPKISFETVDMKGNAVSSNVFSQSRLTMLNVWATYCNPCLSEMPSLGELAAEYDTEDFQLIGVVSDVLEGENQELAESLIEQTGADYPHLLLNESIYYALLTDVSAVPTTFFLDESGTVLGTVIGAREKSAWEEIIDGLLEEL